MMRLKNEIKRIINGLIIGMLVICAIIPINANANENYYTNLNGAVLSQDEYDNLSHVFSKATIATMSTSLINSIKDDKCLKRLLRKQSM